MTPPESPDAPEAGRIEPTSVPRWARALALFFLATLFAAWAWMPMLSAYPRTQNGDGQYFHRIVEAAKVSVFRYGELPLWNPFECGGVPLWDNPQSIIAAPLLWVSAMFDVTRMMEFWYLAHSIVGFVGMWLFARGELCLSRFATLAVAVLWTYSGFHQHHYSGGHAAFVSFLYLPLAFMFWRRAESDLRMAVALGLLFAWMIFEGAVYPLPHFVAVLGAETLTRAWPPRRFLHIARAGLVVGVVALVVGGARFLPVLDQIRSHSRGLGPENDFLKWPTLSDMFTVRAHGRGVAGQEYVWTEYATYIGPMTLVLAALGLLVAGTEYAWMMALLLFTAALMAGHFAHYAPWSILKGHVFPFKEMRVPSRFRLETSFFLVCFAGLAIDRFAPWFARFVTRVQMLARRVVRKSGDPVALSAAWRNALATLMISLGLIAAGDVLGVAMDIHSQFYGSGKTNPVLPSPRLYYGGPDHAAYLDQPRQNRGRLDCWDEWGFGAGAPLWQGDVPQARAKDDAAVIEVGNRTQNTFSIDVDAKREAIILVNSTYDKGWRTNVGETFEENRQLLLKVPPGHHRVKLKYWPKTFTLGLVFTILGLVAALTYLVKPGLFRLPRRHGKSAPSA